MNVCYCVNELASSIVAYRFDEFAALTSFKAARIELGEGGAVKLPTLEPMQEVFDYNFVKRSA